MLESKFTVLQDYFALAKAGMATEEDIVAAHAILRDIEEIVSKDSLSCLVCGWGPIRTGGNCPFCDAYELNERVLELTRLVAALEPDASAYKHLKAMLAEVDIKGLCTLAETLKDVNDK